MELPKEKQKVLSTYGGECEFSLFLDKRRLEEKNKDDIQSNQIKLEHPDFLADVL